MFSKALPTTEMWITSFVSALEGQRHVLTVKQAI